MVRTSGATDAQQNYWRPHSISRRSRYMPNPSTLVRANCNLEDMIPQLAPHDLEDKGGKREAATEGGQRARDGSKEQEQRTEEEREEGQQGGAGAQGSGSQVE